MYVCMYFYLWHSLIRYRAIDGSNRMRIRFNIKGSKGQVYVWAEVHTKPYHSYPDPKLYVGMYVYICIRGLIENI